MQKDERKQIVREGYAVVTATKVRKKKEVSKDVKRKKLKVRIFATEPAKAGILVGHKEGLPNYSSDNFEVYVEIPCYAEEIETVLNDVQELADEMMERRMQEYPDNEDDEEL